ncbi:MAG: cupin domain-containing protein [Acidimicrobiia bacterium]
MEPTVADAVEVEAAGTPPKQIREFVGRVATGHESVSLAVMRSPAGWVEPAQTPDFDEHTAVLSGMLVVHHDGGRLDVRAGQSVTVPAGVRVRYETPAGAEYVAVCLPAFAMDIVHREGA